MKIENLICLILKKIKIVGKKSMFFELELKNKTEYRIKAKKTRKNLDLSVISLKILDQIKNTDFYKKSKNIAAFYPSFNEVNLCGLFTDSAKQWYLPKVTSNTEMVFYNYQCNFELQKNKFGIMEPQAGCELNLDNLDIIFIPALMADKKGYRLGYGKGYYDRFLIKVPDKCLKIVPIPEELTIKELPTDKFDIPADMIITQNKALNLNYNI